MNIDLFRAAFTGGGTRANQFRVDLTIPAAVTGATTAGLLSQFLCTGAQLPASNVASVEVFYRGRAVKVAGERTYEAWTVTILNDTNFAMRNALERWSEMINRAKDNGGVTIPQAYWADLTVTQLDRNNLPLKSYKLVDAFPTTISPIELSFDNNNTVETVTVTFEYQYWESQGITSNAGEIAGAITSILSQ